MNMLLTEWNIDDAKEVWYEEGLEDGLEKGREEGIEAGRREAARKALSRGLSVEVVQEITGLSPADIARL
jgi:predicted transposase/invertase (TIGR01784 family)